MSELMGVQPQPRITNRGPRAEIPRGGHQALVMSSAAHCLAAGLIFTYLNTSHMGHSA